MQDSATREQHEVCNYMLGKKTNYWLNIVIFWTEIPTDESLPSHVGGGETDHPGSSLFAPQQ